MIKKFVLLSTLVFALSGCNRWGVVEIPVNGGTRQIVDFVQLPAWEQWEVIPTPCEQLAVDLANEKIPTTEDACNQSLVEGEIDD